MEMFRGTSRLSLRQLEVLNAPMFRGQVNPRFLQDQIQSTFRTRPATTALRARQLHTGFLKRSSPIPIPIQSRLPLSSRTTRRWTSTDAELSSKPDSQLSFSQRIKKLSREYGWAAFYIYFALSALDFPFCFLAVKMLGTDLIGHWEHVVVSNVKHFLQWPLSGTVQEQVGEALDKVDAAVGTEDTSKRLLEEGGEGENLIDHGYKEAVQANSGSNASLWTQLALAYAIHKSFIFVRVPLTAAVTPKIVKTLRGWGWNIGRPTTRKAKSAVSGGSSSGSSGTGVNTKGSRVKDD